jgi:phage terminase small subunit
MAQRRKKVLTAKQRKFYKEFPKDMNATQAALRAGYSKKSAPIEGCKLLKDIRQHAKVEEAKVQANIQVPALTDQTKGDYTRFLTRLNQLAYVDVRKMFDQHNNAIDIPDLPDDVAPAVAGFEITEEFEGRGEERKSIGFTKKYKLVDPLAAILGLGKVRGFFHDQDDRPQSPLEKAATDMLLQMQASLEARVRGHSA